MSVAAAFSFVTTPAPAAPYALPNCWSSTTKSVLTSVAVWPAPVVTSAGATVPVPVKLRGTQPGAAGGGVVSARSMYGWSLEAPLKPETWTV